LSIKLTLITAASIVASSSFNPGGRANSIPAAGRRYLLTIS
jgi:hypothetical protein